MHRTWTLCLLMVPFAFAGCVDDGAGYTTLAIDPWKEQYEATEGAFLLDVRTREEYAAGHIPNATLIPFDELRERAGELPDEKDTPIFAYCRTGNRSTQAAETLVDLGYTEVVNMRPGGFPDWKAAGHPTSTPSTSSG